MDEFQIDSLLNRKPKIVNLAQLREDVLEYAHFNYAPKTIEAYKLSLNSFIGHIGNRQLSLLGMRDFERFKNERSKSVTKTTVNIELRTLKAVFNYAVRNGLIKANPVKGVRRCVTGSYYCINNSSVIYFVNDSFKINPKGTSCSII
jgi:site-specific recombinase XerD